MESFSKTQIESHSDNSNHTSAGSGKLYHEDFLGGIMFSITMTIFLLILGLGGQRLSWNDPIIISLTAIFVVSSTAFGMREGFWAKKPLIPMWLMRKNGVGLFCVVQILLFGARSAVSKLTFCRCSVVEYSRAAPFQHSALLRAYGRRKQHRCCGLHSPFELRQRHRGTSRWLYHQQVDETLSWEISG